MEVGPGSTIAQRYQVRARLGEGNVGVVYAALDTKFSAQVALKLAEAEGNDYETFQRRFRREAEIGYLLGKAPGFVRALDWGEYGDGQGLYMALDLVPGARPLDLATGPLSARLQRLTRAAGLVAHLHRLKVVHRDLKPDNFLIDARGGMHLSDFGASKWLGKPPSEESTDPAVGLTQPGVLLGTPLYMSPEQFEDPSQITTQADVYSLGVMLFLALTGTYPYSGSNPIQIMSSQVMVRHGDEAPPTPHDHDPQIDPRLNDLAARATSLEADQRPDANELRRLLEELSGGQRRTGRRPTAATGRPPRPETRTTNRPPPPESRQPAPPPAPAPTSPPAQPPQPRVVIATRPELGERLGLDVDGFAAWVNWRTLWSSLGEEAFLSLLGDRPVLKVVDERPLNGTTRYLGKVGLVCSREHLRAHRVQIGRTHESDLTIQLPSMSKEHATIVQRKGRWFLADLNSSNGTELDGRAVRRDEQPLAPGAQIQFGQHVTCTFLLPAEVCAALATG